MGAGRGCGYFVELPNFLYCHRRAELYNYLCGSICTVCFPQLIKPMSKCVVTIVTLFVRAVEKTMKNELKAVQLGLGTLRN